MSSDPQLANIIWVLLCSAMVMLMQGGFCLLECGLARAKNSINVAVKNLIDFCVAAVAFWAFGFAFMFGKSYLGLIGTTGYCFENQCAWALTFFLFQFVFCGTSTTIISGAVAERMRFSAYLVISLLVSGFIYPIFGHWAWAGADLGQAQGWLNSRGFIDFAGSTVVHSVGGWVSLAAAIILGPRIGRFGAKPAPIHGHNLPMATLGVMVLWFGWFGFNGGSTLAVTDKIPLILVNTSLAAAFGGVTGLAIAWCIEKRPDVPQLMNGVIAGLVAITAGCHVMSLPCAIAVGCLGAAVTCGLTYLLAWLEIDDVVGSFPVHAGAGVFGTLAVALFGNVDAFGTGLTRWEQLQIQSLGVGACCAWAFGGGFCCLYLLNKIHPLRVTQREEYLGLNISEHGASTELLDLLDDMSKQRQDGDFGRKVAVEPHTEVGQIALEYNRVLDRVQAEIAEREDAEQRFRSIFDNAIEGIFQSTPDGRYLNANPALARIYGYDTVEQLFAGVADISQQLYVEPGRREEFMRLLEVTDSIKGFESQIYRQDGSIIWISESARACRGPDGAVLYYEGSVDDITQRRQAERLILEKQEAEAANKAKSAFLATMSHEIRTPLNGVIGMLDLLGGTELSSQQRRYNEIAKSSADILLSLINQILDFSKIEAGKLELEQISFDLRRLIEDVPDMFVHRAAEKRLELICSPAATLPSEVRGDPERLRQIIVNLVSNAIKFTQKGEVAIRVEPLPAEADGRVPVKFSVSDSGIGIPSERINRLFSAFSQVDASTTRQYGGTGLGLAICRQIVEAMGGRIGVDSKVGRGSTFWFVVPFPVVAAQAGERILPRELLAAKILAVDDNDTNLEILREQLGRWGLEVETHNNSTEALAILKHAVNRKAPFQAAILDCLMPGLNGLQLAEKIRQTDSFGKIPLLILSSLDSSISSEDARRLNLTVLQKPIRQSRLFDAIVNLTVQRETIAVAPEPELEPEVAVRGGGTILIADDNEINRLVASEILQSAGYQTSTACNGCEAVQTLREKKFDAVLMDCEMPEMDGFTATKEIRRLESRCELISASGAPLPIIALTAQAVKGDRERCLAAGMNDYVTKPIDRQKLLAALAEQLAAAAAAGPREQNQPLTPPPVQPPSAEAPHSDRPDLHLPELKERCLNKLPFVAKILTKFREDVNVRRETIARALEANDVAVVAREAHTLKGAAANVAAHRLSAAAAVMEASAKAGRTDDCRAATVELEHALERCCDRIAALLQDAEGMENQGQSA